MRELPEAAEQRGGLMQRNQAVQSQSRTGRMPACRTGYALARHGHGNVKVSSSFEERMKI